MRSLLIPSLAPAASVAVALALTLATPPARAHSGGFAVMGCAGCHNGGTPPSISLKHTPESPSPGDTVTLEITNRGDRPVQVGSHYPFFETNRALVFDRAKAYGRRLDIPAGTAVRFEPGEKKTVSLVAIAGARVVWGGNALGSGPVTPENQERALAEVAARGFGHEEGA